MRFLRPSHAPRDSGVGRHWAVRRGLSFRWRPLNRCEDARSLVRMGCGSSQLSEAARAPENPDKLKFRQPTVVDLLASEAAEHDALLARWGSSVFKQFDADGNGRLDGKELAAALKKLPMERPKNVPPGTKMMTVDQLIHALDSDGDGTVSMAEWLSNLSSCVGLAHCLTEIMDRDGNIPGFEGHTRASKPAADESTETVGQAMPVDDTVPAVAPPEAPAAEAAACVSAPDTPAATQGAALPPDGEEARAATEPAPDGSAAPADDAAPQN